MSTSEDLVIVDSSDYAQVVFDDVSECYSNVKRLVCEFTLNELLKTSGEESIDWIGIYKVGFSDCSEYVCNLPVDTVTENKGKVVFPSKCFSVLFVVIFRGLSILWGSTK